MQTLGMIAWIVASSASAALSHIAIEHLADASSAATGYRSHAHPVFVPIVLATIVAASIGLWGHVARLRLGETTESAAVALGSSVVRIPRPALFAAIFAGALAILSGAECAEQLIATGHASLGTLLGADSNVGVAIVALVAYTVTAFGSSLARTATALLLAGARALEIIAERARSQSNVREDDLRTSYGVVRACRSPIAIARALRAPPLAP